MEKPDINKSEISESDKQELVDSTISARKEAKMDSEEAAIKGWAEGREREVLEPSSSPKINAVFEQKMKENGFKDANAVDRLTFLAKRIDEEMAKVPGGVASEELEREACFVLGLASDNNEENEEIIKNLSYETLVDLVDFENSRKLSGSNMTDEKAKSFKKAYLLDGDRSAFNMMGGVAKRNVVQKDKGTVIQLDANTKKVEDESNKPWYKKLVNAIGFKG